MHALHRRDYWAWTFGRQISDSRKSGNSRRPSEKWIDRQYLTDSRWSIAVSNLSLSFLGLVRYWEKNRRRGLSQFFFGRKLLHFGKCMSPMKFISIWKGSHRVFCVSLYSLWPTMKSKSIYFSESPSFRSEPWNWVLCSPGISSDWNTDWLAWIEFGRTYCRNCPKFLHMLRNSGSHMQLNNQSFTHMYTDRLQQIWNIFRWENLLARCQDRPTVQTKIRCWRSFDCFHWSHQQRSQYSALLEGRLYHRVWLARKRPSKIYLSLSHFLSLYLIPRRPVLRFSW